MVGMLLNKIVLQQYDSDRATSFIMERNRLSSLLQHMKYQIIHINEGSVKFTIAEPVTDICVGLFDPLDIDLVRLTLLNNGYAMVKKASTYDLLVFYRLEGPYIKSRIYVTPMGSSYMRLYEAFKKFLLDSYQHVNEFNDFMTSNYKLNRNKPNVFRQKRLEFINKVVRRIN